MNVELDPEAPAPLYRQIAESLRYGISSGALVPGEQLPTLREAAAEWGVNLHTVRKAYAHLSESGLVRFRPPVGVFVADGDAVDESRDARTVATRYLRELRDRFGLSADAAVALVQDAAAAVATAPTRVIECSHTLSEDLAAQIAELCGVPALGTHLDDIESIPAGPVVATYFHYNEVRAALAERLSDLHFVAIEPSPEALGPVIEHAGEHGAGRVVLCEPDGEIAPAIAADLERMLARASLAVDPVSTDDPAALLTDATGPVLFSPASWERLDDTARNQARAFLLRYRLAPRDAELLSRVLGRPR